MPLHLLRDTIEHRPRLRILQAQQARCRCARFRSDLVDIVPLLCEVVGSEIVLQRLWISLVREDTAVSGHTSTLTGTAEGSDLVAFDLARFALETGVDLATLVGRFVVFGWVGMVE